jgi:hypothetical protein
MLTSKDEWCGLALLRVKLIRRGMPTYRGFSSQGTQTRQRQ